LIGELSVGRSCFGEQASEIPTGEAPFDGASEGFIAVLEGEQPVFDFGQAAKVARRQDLALDDREVDLDLIEPTRVDRSMDHGYCWMGSLEPLNGGCASVGRPIVHDPKDTSCFSVRRGSHDFGHQPPEWIDARARLTAPEQLGAVDIQCGEVGSGAPRADIHVRPAGLVQAEWAR
jgi:hypothetical protein